MKNHIEIARFRAAVVRIVCMAFVSVLLFSTEANGQSRLRLDAGNMTLRELFDNIKEQLNYEVFFNVEKVDVSQTITVSGSHWTLDEVLAQVLPPLKLTHEIINGTIVVSARDDAAAVRQKNVQVTGVVRDEDGNPMAGALVMIAGRTAGTITDSDGRFSLSVNSLDEVLTVSFVGYINNGVRLDGRSEVTVSMEPDTFQVDDVIITGYFPKAKNSFTGTAVTVSGDDLRNINNVSIFDALKVFDPSFKVVDGRGFFGSDPNRIPDRIEIRGQNSFPEIDLSENALRTYTSLPVFILDGFEITVQQVYDLDMNQIERITLLKDAAASAIYGSRAANGVVVIESKIPEAGKLQISYTLNGSVQIPDLSSYNLMNAAEALEFQRLAGVFDPITPGEDAGNRLNTYNLIKQEVLQGTDTYWLSKPLRVALLHKHSVFIDGAIGRGRSESHNLRYQINLSAGSNQGVMKGSSRNQYGGGTKLLYSNNKLHITNNLQFALVTGNESPYGNFGTYTQTLPYYREKDANGQYYRTLTMRNVAPEGMALDYGGGAAGSQRSPVYEAKYLSSFARNESVDFYNNFGINWTILPSLMVKGNFRLSNTSTRSDIYLSPMSFTYIDNDSELNTPEVILDRGRYDLSNSSALSATGNVVVSYTQNFGKHLVQAIFGGELRQTDPTGDRYRATGIMDDALDYLSYANQFDIHGRPGGNELPPVRSAGAFSNINYSYDNRYLIDLTGRLDGSSLFGRNNFTAPFWSAGVRWNVSKEKFMSGMPFIDNLAIRATVGTLGNQNFTLNQVMTLYSWMTASYGPFMGASVNALGNPDLKWQTAWDRNIGLEFSLWNRRVNGEVNYYSKITRDNITEITIAPSIGFSNYMTNMGDLMNQGVDFSLSVTPVRTRDCTLNILLNGSHNRNTIKSISESLRRYNDMIGAQAQEKGTTVFLFREGQSMNTLYAVRSLGIDIGTGREIFLDRNGERSFEWNAADQVPVGNSEPALEGFLGINFRYKAWDLGATFNYSTGADRYNYTLHEKVEGVDRMTNNDRRALTQRWKEPGDVARYKSIRDQSITRPTSRFVQKEHMVSLTSMRVSYTVPAKRLLLWNLSLLRMSATVNDLFYLSTIRQERGLYYPYARTVNFSLQINF